MKNKAACGLADTVMDPNPTSGSSRLKFSKRAVIAMMEMIRNVRITYNHFTYFEDGIE